MQSNHEPAGVLCSTLGQICDQFYVIGILIGFFLEMSFLVCEWKHFLDIGIWKFTKRWENGTLAFFNWYFPIKFS